MEGGIVDREGADRARWGVPGLETDGDPAQTGSPDPSAAMLVVRHVQFRPPDRTGPPESADLLNDDIGGLGPPLASVSLGEQVLLEHIGQSRHADTKQPYAARHVDRRAAGRWRPSRSPRTGRLRSAGCATG